MSSPSRPGWAGRFIGVVLLATATSLPELGTGVSSITLVDEPDLAVGDAFGSNLFNLLIIGLLDLFWRNGPILGSVSITSVLIGSLGIMVISLAAVGMLIHNLTPAMANWTLSPVTVLILVVFLVAMFLIYKFEQRERNDGDYAARGVTDEDEDGGEQYADESMVKTVVIYGLSAGLVVGAAIWLSIIGEKSPRRWGGRPASWAPSSWRSARRCPNWQPPSRPYASTPPSWR